MCSTLPGGFPSAVFFSKMYREASRFAGPVGVLCCSLQNTLHDARGPCQAAQPSRNSGHWAWATVVRAVVC